jgi:4-aminobutyrate aminotransferase
MTNELKSRSKKVLSNVIGRFFDLEISHGSGSYLYTHNNKKYLDFGAGIAVTSTGHCHPDIVSAIQKQATTLIHPCIATGHYESPIVLAEKLCTILKPHDCSIFFNQSGSEAVETAIKLARYVSKKQTIIAFEGSFHGRTYGALSLTSSKKKYWEGYGKLLDDITFIPYPNLYRCPWGKTTPEESLKEHIHFLENTPLLNSTVAAIIIEPVLGEGGYVPAPTAYLKKLEEICKKNNILIIFDEIQSGIGRTGTWFNFQQHDIDFDIITSAKGLGSGMPLAACIAKKHLMDQWPPGAHGGTYGANPVTCAAGLATLNVLEPLLSQVTNLSKKAFKFLKDNLNNHPYIGNIRGTGYMIGIECVKDKHTKEPYKDIIGDILKKCLDRELIILSCGVHENVIRIIPPLTCTESELMQGLSIFCEVLHDIH